MLTLLKLLEYFKKYFNLKDVMKQLEYEKILPGFCHLHLMNAKLKKSKIPRTNSYESLDVEKFSLYVCLYCG